MDLQLKGRRAVVCGAETPLSQACAMALLGEGVIVTLVSASALPDGLLAQAFASDAASPALNSLVASVADPAGVDAVLGACPCPDIIVNHAPGLPPADFRDISLDDWFNGIRKVMLPGILLSSRVYDGMVERRFGRIVNITSQCVKAAMDNLDISNASRAVSPDFLLAWRATSAMLM